MRNFLEDGWFEVLGMKLGDGGMLLFLRGGEKKRATVLWLLMT
jgi:hypothetical protein